MEKKTNNEEKVAKRPARKPAKKKVCIFCVENEFCVGECGTIGVLISVAWDVSGGF